jgi:hypothetical protein
VDAGERGQSTTSKVPPPACAVQSLVDRLSGLKIASSCSAAASGPPPPPAGGGECIRDERSVNTVAAGDGEPEVVVAPPEDGGLCRTES